MHTVFTDPGDYFLYQPCNVTIKEDEQVKFNCIPTKLTGQLVNWVINGEHHYWIDFMEKPEFKLNIT